MSLLVFQSRRPLFFVAVVVATAFVVLVRCTAKLYEVTLEAFGTDECPKTQEKKTKLKSKIQGNVNGNKVSEFALKCVGSFREFCTRY